MKLEYPFVKACPRCEAPVAFWELSDGVLLEHLEDLHEMRLIDISFGRPPRFFLSDSWDVAGRQWKHKETRDVQL
jgi:hypothetical protein